MRHVIKESNNEPTAQIKNATFYLCVQDYTKWIAKVQYNFVPEKLVAWCVLALWCWRGDRCVMRQNPELCRTKGLFADSP